MKRVFTWFFMLAVASICFTGCEVDVDSEPNVVEESTEALNDAGDAVSDAADNAGDAMSDAADDVGDAVDEASDDLDGN